MPDENKRLPVRSSLFRFPYSLPSLWEDMEDRMRQWMGPEGQTGVSVSEDDKNVYVEAHLPGLKSDDIDISFHQNLLMIKGERQEQQEDKKRKFYRQAQSNFFYQLELPCQVEETDQADFQNGVLKITFKKAQQSQIHKIKITNSPYRKDGA